MRLNAVFLIMLGLAILPGCWGGEKPTSKVKVFNVLSAADYHDCHIPGSINIPFETFDITRIKKQYPLDTELVVYCSDYQCTASDYIAEKLHENGYNQVAIYRAGIKEWYQAGYPVSGACTHDYLKGSLEPTVEEGNIPVISTEELARKLNIEKKRMAA